MNRNNEHGLSLAIHLRDYYGFINFDDLCDESCSIGFIQDIMFCLKVLDIRVFHNTIPKPLFAP